VLDAKLAAILPLSHDVPVVAQMHGSPGSLGIGSAGRLELHSAQQRDRVSHPDTLHLEPGCR